MLELHTTITERRSPAPIAAVSSMRIDECDVDVAGIALPSPQVHLSVRFGPALKNGIDLHVMGVRDSVRRKMVRGGQRAVIARLQLGVPASVLGVPASALVGGIVDLGDVWGSAASRRLADQLANARTTSEAALVLDDAIAARVVVASAHETLVRTAARLLRDHSVADVAGLVGVSERQLRRVFGDVVGVGPKLVAQLQRFRRAVHAAMRASERTDGWAGIAVDVGYYDQAHLIAEFHQLAGTTPTALLGELRTARLLG